MRGLAVLAGLAGATCWLVLFSLLGTGLPDQVWWTFAAGCVAWLAALLLVRYGDRGVAVGVAVVTGLGWAVAGGAVAVHWGFTGDWPLW